MEELGRFLKAAREEKGITLAEVSEITKIHRRHLEAIEEGQFDRLPGPVYAKAFLRHYARAVGLDPEYVVDQYRQHLGLHNVDEQQVPGEQGLSSVTRYRERRRRKAVRRARRLRRWLVIVLVLLAAAAGVYWAIEQWRAADSGFDAAGGFGVEPGLDSPIALSMGPTDAGTGDEAVPVLPGADALQGTDAGARVDDGDEEEAGADLSAPDAGAPPALDAGAPAAGSGADGGATDETAFPGWEDQAAIEAMADAGTAVNRLDHEGSESPNSDSGASVESGLREAPGDGTGDGEMDREPDRADPGGAVQTDEFADVEAAHDDRRPSSLAGVDLGDSEAVGVSVQAVHAPAEDDAAILGPEPGVVLQVRLVADCWFDVIADGRRIFSGTLRAGEEATWVADEVLQVRFGRPEGVFLTLNGQPLGRAGSGVITREFRKDGTG